MIDAVPLGARAGSPFVASPVREWTGKRLGGRCNETVPRLVMPRFFRASDDSWVTLDGLTSLPNSSLARMGAWTPGSSSKLRTFSSPRYRHEQQTFFHRVEATTSASPREWLAGSIAEYGRFGGRMEEDTRKESSRSDMARLLESIVDGPVFGGRKADKGGVTW